MLNAVVNHQPTGTERTNRNSCETFRTHALGDPRRRQAEVHPISGVRENERRRRVDGDEVRERRTGHHLKQEPEERKFQRIRQLSRLLDVGFRFGLGHAAERGRLAKLSLKENQLGRRCRCWDDFRVVQGLLQGAQQRRRQGSTVGVNSVIT